MLQLFQYYAQSPKGSLVVGSARARTPQEATTRLRERYQQLYLVEPRRTFGLHQLTRPRMGLVEKIILVKNLYVMLKSGMPIDEAFHALHEQSARHATKKITAQIRNQLRAGSSLSAALGAFPEAFNPLFINLVYVGEKSGTLDANLQHLARELEHRLELRRKIRGAMLYPSIILFSVVILSVLMIKFVLPQITKVFKSIHIDLPVQTRVFLQISEFLQNYVVIIAACIIGAWALVRFLLKRLPLFHAKWIHLETKIPIIGTLVASYNLAQITRTLGVLMQAGLPLTEALDITALTTENVYYKLEIIKAKQLVVQGKSLGESLAPKRVTPLVTQIITIGEKSGNLEPNLLYLSEFYNNRIDYLTKDLPTILEPVLLLLVGVAVAFVAMAILTPLYEFTASAGR